MATYQTDFYKFPARAYSSRNNGNGAFPSAFMDLHGSQFFQVRQTAFDKKAGSWSVRPVISLKAASFMVTSNVPVAFSNLKIRILPLKDY